MDWVRVFFACLYILLGIVISILGRFLPSKLFMPNPKKWRVVEADSFIKVGRAILYAMGLFWIACGIIVLALYIILRQFLLNNFVVQEIIIIAPAIIAVCISYHRNRFLKRII